MWKLSIIQNYYDCEGFWAGQGYPVSLESKFGQTEAVLNEIQNFLKEENDKKPLEVKTDDLNDLWKKAREDPRKQYQLTLREEEYTPPRPNDDFEGVVCIELYATYEVNQTPTATPIESNPQPEPEQLNLF